MNYNILLNNHEHTQIKDIHENINRSDRERDNKLLSINTTIFAIVITLTSLEKDNKLLLCLYLSTIIIFVISIITGFIQTTINSPMYRKLLNKYLEKLADLKSGKDEDNVNEISIKTSPFFQGTIK